MDARLLKCKSGDIICNDEGVFTPSFLRLNPQLRQHKKITVIDVKRVESLVPAVIMTVMSPDGRVMVVMDENVIMGSVIKLQ